MQNSACRVGSQGQIQALEVVQSREILGPQPRWLRPKLWQLEAAQETEAARKPKASRPGLWAAMQGPQGSTAGFHSSVVARHMGIGIPLVVNRGREEQEEQEVQEL